MSLVEAQVGMTDLIPCSEQCGADMGHYSWSQTDSEVVVTIPLAPNTATKSLCVLINTNELSIGIKGQPPILCGTFFKPIRADESLWCVEEKKRLVATLFKSNLKYEEWWPHVCLQERQVDMKTLKPPSKHIRDLDGGAQATVSKMMFDQDQKRKGLPTSDEQKMQELMRGMK